MTLPAWLFFALILPSQSPQPAAPAAVSPAMANWKQGQQAMLEGHTEQAIASFKASLAQDASMACNYLSLAAAYLARGQDEQAADQLALYLKAQPDHFVARGQYAELLQRLDRLDEARDQYERFESDLQDHETLAQKHMVRCHTRLMDIAASIEDDYALHLHRGIGLYWLARQHGDAKDEEDEQLSREGLLCRAASELVQARREKPDDARACWYLHEVWSSLGQKQPALRWLRAAEEAAPFSYLTPAEQRHLHLACRRHAEDGTRK